MQNDQCPVEIEVSRSIIWENARDLLVVRARNSGQEAITFTIEIRCDLTGAQEIEVSSLPGRGEREFRVDTNPMSRGNYGMQLRVLIDSGCSYLGHIDRAVSFSKQVQIDSINIGPSNSGDAAIVVQDAPINVNIDSGECANLRSPERIFESVVFVTDWEEQAPMLAVLQHQSGERITVACLDCLTFGRKPESVVVVASSQSVSREHCKLVFELGKLWVRHMSGSNATFMNDTQVFEGMPCAVPPEEDVSLRLAGTSWTGNLRAIPGDERAISVANWLRSKRASAPRPSDLRTGAIAVKPTSEADISKGSVLWIRSVINLQDVESISPTWSPTILAASGGLLNIQTDADGAPYGASPLRAGMLLGETWTVVKAS